MSSSKDSEDEQSKDESEMVNDGDADVECDGNEQALSAKSAFWASSSCSAPSSAPMALSVDK